MSNGNKYAELDRIYAEIPGFKCVDGCMDCCGPMPYFSPLEWERHTDKRFATGDVCPYKGDDGCEGYEFRGFICRLFGTVDGFTCAKGGKPSGLLTEEQGKALKIRYYETEEG